jgi:hypothetical protein
MSRERTLVTEPMRSLTIEELFMAKHLRRRDLAQLPLDQKIDLIEKLRAMRRALIAARATLPPPSKHPSSR